MPRRATSLPLSLPPRPEGTAGYLWLYDAIRQQVAGGRLEPGCRLPSTRDLARQFGMSRGTAVTAFEMLLAEGYLESASGSGTRVSRALPGASRAGAGRLRTPACHDGYRPPLVASCRSVNMRRPRARPSAPTSRRLIRSPSRSGRGSRRGRCRGVTPSLLAGGEPLGHGPLRSAIAEYLAISRGVVCDPDRVVVVSGTQEALAVIATCSWTLATPSHRGSRLWRRNAGDGDPWCARAAAGRGR